MTASELQPLPAPAEDPWLPFVRKIAAGDHDALAELYDQSSSTVFGLVCRIVNDREVAEEVTIDVYTQLWRKASDFDGDRGRATSWILLLARSRAIDYLRSSAGKQRRRELPLDPTREPPASELDSENSTLALSRRQSVQRALAQLDENKRTAVELAFFGGFTHSEIAARLGSPLGTVKTRIRQAMIELRAFLEERGEVL